MAARKWRPPLPESHLDTGSRTARRHPARLTRLGFVPLLDAAPLMVAEALGLFEAVGLNVAISVEPSWATLRDRLAAGALDGAHLLGPMPIALAAGLGGVQARLTIGCGLGRNGNTITLRPELAARVAARGAAALRGATLAVVFAFSSHNYLLRHWLAAAGLDPDRDLRLLVVPPPQMPAQLAAGHIDGFCAGEPWGSHAVALGAGRIALTTGDIWPDHPEKVLAFNAAWAHENRETAIAITAAVMAASRWLDDAQNAAEAARITRTRAFAHLPLETIATALRQPFSFRAAAMPYAAEAGWWMGQMRRWGHLPEGAAAATLLDAWNTSLCRAAAARIGEDLTLFSPTEPPQ